MVLVLAAAVGCQGGAEDPGGRAGGSSALGPRTAQGAGFVQVGHVSPDYAADGKAHVACSEIEARFTVGPVDPSGAPAHWRATALDHDPGEGGAGIDRGVAPDVVITPDAGTLEPGGQATVRVRGRFDGERPVFWVLVEAPGPDGDDVRQRIAFSCR
ncbi:hypothetical protein [Streptomyces sp. WAC06614]|uniref:hypothetical protein n=1 Tax=Streptomyces sp. WAC06614 TaxID=2487416 RepID=UPI000F79CBF9|nr:hypothetical protein [Streptomyces sp. WAC06614]RSS62151.1 hypothetical protein EF918_31425 [Streptomyces sp. WAC06614]